MLNTFMFLNSLQGKVSIPWPYHPWSVCCRLLSDKLIGPLTEVTIKSRRSRSESSQRDTGGFVWNETSRQNRDQSETETATSARFLDKTSAQLVFFPAGVSAVKLQHKNASSALMFIFSSEKSIRGDEKADLHHKARRNRSRRRVQPSVSRHLSVMSSRRAILTAPEHFWGR